MKKVIAGGGWGGVVEWVVESKFETGGYGTC